MAIGSPACYRNHEFRAESVARKEQRVFRDHKTAWPTRAFAESRRVFENNEFFSDNLLTFPEYAMLLPGYTCRIGKIDPLP